MIPKKAKNCPICKLNESLVDCICPIDRTGQVHGKINIDTVIQGKMDNLPNNKIAELAGSKATSESAKSQCIARVEKTKEYKDKTKDVIAKLESIRDKQLNAIDNGDMSKVKHKHLVSSLDKIVKTLLLLDGKATSRIDISESDVSKFLSIS